MLEDGIGHVKFSKPLPICLDENGDGHKKSKVKGVEWEGGWCYKNKGK